MINFSQNSNNLIDIDEMLRTIVKCPMCGHETKYGSMKWLNGRNICPNCYESLLEDSKRAYEKGKRDLYNLYKEEEK